jgi:hypothetical protein
MEYNLLHNYVCIDPSLHCKYLCNVTISAIAAGTYLAVPNYYETMAVRLTLEPDEKQKLTEIWWKLFERLFIK